jgi:hypothetical protein
MQIEHIDRLVQTAELHQERLSKLHSLVTHCDEATPQVKAIVLTQILDLATASTYLLTTEMTPKYSAPPRNDEGVMMNYTFSAEDLDAEMGDDYLEGDEDDDLDDDEGNPVR